MKKILEGFEPNGRENCLCGSQERYKNCCKEEWPKYNYTEKKEFASSLQELRYLRAHVTWYRLCHLAHTVPLTKLRYHDGKLLRIDIEAMHDFVRGALQLYEKCGILDSYPCLLDELKGAISDVRWEWKILTERALFYLVIKNDYDAARAALAQYEWENIGDSDLLEVYLDAYSDEAGHVDSINIASKIVELTKKDSSRFHYRLAIAFQYFLMNESEKAERLAKDALKAYEDIPVEKRDVYGRRILGTAVKQLGQILNDGDMLRRAIELLAAEVDVKRYKSNAIAEIWYEVAECHHMLKEYYMAEKLYCRSISIESTALANIYLAKVQLDLGRLGRAKEILGGIVFELMSAPNRFDYAIVKCDVALVTKDAKDIEDALSLIKGIETKDPYFKDLIQGLLVALYELSIGKGTVQMDSILARLNRYVTLNPNLAGVGVNFNAMIDDYLKRRPNR
ncbi:tetratricopeptide repeat protein [Pseudomonas sp. CFBP 5750]